MQIVAAENFGRFVTLLISNHQILIQVFLILSDANPFNDRINPHDAVLARVLHCYNYYLFIYEQLI